MMFVVLSRCGLSAQTYIDLAQECRTDSGGSVCTGRTWWIADSFEEKFISDDGPARFSDSSTPEGWTKISALKTGQSTFPIWVNRARPVDRSFATYTFITFFDAGAELKSGGRQPGIRLGEIGEVFEIYLNGRLIVKEGVASNEEVQLHRTVRGTVWPVNAGCLKEKNNRLVIKIQGDPRYDHTGFYLTQRYDFGFFDELMTLREDRMSWILIALYFFTGAYHLLLYMKRRKENYNFYFGGFCVLLFIYLMTRTDIIFELQFAGMPLDTILIQRVELAVLYAAIPMMLAFTDVFFYKKLTIITKSYYVFCLLLIPPVIFLPMYLAEQTLKAWEIAAVFPGFSYPTYVLIKESIKKHRDARRLLIGHMINISAAIFDLIDAAILNTGLSFTKYGFSFYILGIAVVLANRFLRVHNEVEELNVNLEKKVEDRTAQLQNTLTEVQNLKVQQDGDYFLTSLLIKPLGQNLARSETVSLEFLVRQKKTFHFRKWDSEIGGDLCISHSIQLRGRTYSVFINGDAMGKSIQGAGGALVLGVVFNSVVARTQQLKSAGEKYPEQWLKECFIELQNIFISFDGTMLVSVVMGLVDDSCGFIYFINAEHPRPVLFREGRAEFVGRPDVLRKIGSRDIERPLSVETFRMRPGDIVIVGSDGRDDLILRDDGAGNRVINEDENLFVKVVERSAGVLSFIEKEIHEEGAISDDLSLIQITYQNHDEAKVSPEFETKMNLGRQAFSDKNYSEALHQFGQARAIEPDNVQLAVLTARALRRSKNYKELTSHCEAAAVRFPWNTELIYLLSLGRKKSGDYRQAADDGERVRLRKPDHLKNLLNLAEIYLRMKNHGRAATILNEILVYDPQNAAALKFLKTDKKAVQR